MADVEETPAQRQARLRRQKREAKINANASDRLDKITRLSGRTPEHSKNVYQCLRPALTSDYSAT
jgi:GET complex subunit GET2